MPTKKCKTTTRENTASIERLLFLYIKIAMESSHIGLNIFFIDLFKLFKYDRNKKSGTVRKDYSLRFLFHVRFSTTFKRFV